MAQERQCGGREGMRCNDAGGVRVVGDSKQLGVGTGGGGVNIMNIGMKKKKTILHISAIEIFLLEPK